MLNREQISFIIMVVLLANGIWFLSKISNRGLNPLPEMPSISIPTPTFGDGQKVLPPAEGKVAAWDDASSMVQKSLACVEWGPIPDDDVMGVKSVLVASGLHDKILVKETPSKGSWAVSFDVPEGKTKAFLDKSKAQKLEVTERKDGSLYAGPFSSEDQAKKMRQTVTSKIGLQGTIVISTPPSLNTVFILTDVNDAPLISFKRAASMVDIAEIRAAPCPGALGIAADKASKNK